MSFISPDRFLSVTIARAAQCEVDEAVRLIIARLNLKFRVTSGDLDLRSIYDIEPPAGGAHLSELALWTPKSNPSTSAYITNLRDGWSSMSYLVSKELRHFQIQIISTRDGAEFPQHMFQLWRGGVLDRSVMVMRDSDSWVFFEKGLLEEFEETNLYRRRFKRERLDRVVLLRYLECLGFDLNDPLFWTAARPCTLFRQSIKPTQSSPAEQA